MLQRGRSTVAERIEQMDARYANLLFAACGNTLQRFRREQGESIEILPQAVIVQSGVSFVARRQQQGWAYIKV
jgi:intracellular sulfur oxidation DsrE/DsrF family protein